MEAKKPFKYVNSNSKGFSRIHKGEVFEYHDKKRWGSWIQRSYLGSIPLWSLQIGPRYGSVLIKMVISRLRAWIIGSESYIYTIRFGQLFRTRINSADYIYSERACQSWKNSWKRISKGSGVTRDMSVHWPSWSSSTPPYGQGIPSIELPMVPLVSLPFRIDMLNYSKER